MNGISIDNYLNKISKWIPLIFVLYTTLIFILTLIPADRLSPSRLWEYDKLWHMLFFGLWTLKLGLLFKYNLSNIKPGSWAIGMAGFLFGLFIEGLQYLLPVRRAADPYDILANALGVLLAFVVLRKLIYKK